ncbi:MAG: DUF3991 and toprim domain-containing protein [Lachnospiraceae bacterium]|nr:DUF3991 and toprim domain-containing protein [Lachnospiraceae bacterium]
MTSNVSTEQIHMARQTDLYAFLVKYHALDFIHEGDSIRPKNNHSISIKRGYSGYKDFSNNETGNSIEFLVNHMGYTFVSAVQSLTGETTAAYSTNIQQNLIKDIPPQFPPPVKGKYKNLFAYLTNRGIPAETIQMLVVQEILYQEKTRNNIVFINYERNFAELRGTYTYGKPFHGVASNCRSDGFWWFRTSKNADKAYICEAAIDAVSLYQLHKIHGNNEAAYYISIAGAAKQPAIDRLKHSKLILILATDNDTAGQMCRNRNPDLKYILPKLKDWNEDLLALQKHT